MISGLIISQEFLVRIHVVDGKKDDTHSSQPLGWKNPGPWGALRTILFMKPLHLQDLTPILESLVINVFAIR